ncbi:MAG TPA: Clp protease N-terminal domain-containing protein [Streptosporangiaceae bacterium]|nr:Clp protease N-terminal domain-containing protein [Streptosporangiaceae bacterium]
MTPPPTLQELIRTVRRDSPTASALDLLVTASTTVSQLEDLNDALLEHFVSGCRREGKSWSEISAALGVSKQAVHKRFSGAIADRIISSTSAPTFERFTARARTALKEAIQAAQARGGTAVDAGDLLAGLLAVPEGLAAKVLVAMGVTADAVRTARPAAATPAAASAAPATPPAQAAPSEQPTPSAQAAPSAQATTAGLDAAAGATRPPFAPDAVTALRDALAEALELGHNYIGTEHILLGVMRDPDAPASALLSRLGASPAEARVRIAELLRGFTAGPATAQ